MKAICFDFDGTLVDSEPLHYASWKEELQLFGCEFPLQMYLEECSGVSTVKVAQKLIDLYGLSIAAEQLAKQKTHRFVNRLAHELPVPQAGAEALLNSMEATSLKIALVTGSYRVEIERILDGLGWSHYFEHIVTRDDVSEAKPHPEPYLKTLAAIGVDPNDAWALEDSRTGIQSAWNAGLQVCAIQTQHHKVSHDVNYHHLFHSLAEFGIYVRTTLDQTSTN